MYAAPAPAEGPLIPLLPFREDGAVGEGPAERLPGAAMEVSRAGKAFDEAMVGVETLKVSSMSAVPFKEAMCSRILRR